MYGEKVLKRGFGFSEGTLMREKRVLWVLFLLFHYFGQARMSEGVMFYNGLDVSKVDGWMDGWI